MIPHVQQAPPRPCGTGQPWTSVPLMTWSPVLQSRYIVCSALVQIGGLAANVPISIDTLVIEQGSIPGGRRQGIFKHGNGEVELPLANAVDQFDARNGGRHVPETSEAEHRVRS
jgi:hypothetical protein